ncbi:MAG: hypothetical protein ACRDHL_15000 [Candidatus Promineifilaceae bacterium]
MPGGTKRQTWLLFGIYVVQADVIIFMREAAPVVSAFHPVLAIVSFGLAFVLARQASALGQEALAEPRPLPTT